MKNNDLEWVRNHYKVPAEIGKDVLVGGRKGTITHGMGNYIGVTFHDDPKMLSRPCHPTSEVEYLDTYTPITNCKAKNQRSKDRYQAYLDADSYGSFREFLGIKNKTTP